MTTDLQRAYHDRLIRRTATTAIDSLLLDTRTHAPDGRMIDSGTYVLDLTYSCRHDTADRIVTAVRAALTNLGYYTGSRTKTTITVDFTDLPTTAFDNLTREQRDVLGPWISFYFTGRGNPTRAAWEDTRDAINALVVDGRDLTQHGLDILTEALDLAEALAIANPNS